MAALYLVFPLLLVVAVEARSSSEWSIPYQVSVEVKGEFISNGAIISVFWVLTVASGLDNVTSDEVLVRGASPPVWRGAVHRAQEVVRHPNYSMNNEMDSNLVLLKLLTRLTFGSQTHPITLWPISPAPGSVGWVSGWRTGQVIKKVRSRSKSFQIPAVIQDPGQCVAEDSEQLVCVGLQEWVYTLGPKDRGALLLVSRRLAGLYLRRANNTSLVFSAVGPHISWINRAAFGIG